MSAIAGARADGASGGRGDRWDFHFIDCRVHTPHLERFGATDWPRESFLGALATATGEPTRRGSWSAPFRRAVENAD